MKTKLVAIAKDEAAYLPEWIFHHLYFGFDEIEILVNFTTDCSFEVLEKIQSNCPVKFRNADDLIIPENNQHDHLISPAYLKMNLLQSRAYAEILSNAPKDGFSHVMFLDIDELWMPLDFNNTIDSALIALGDPDIAYFERKNKVSDTQEFCRPFQQEIRAETHRLPKCIVKTDIEIELTSSHGARYLGQGRPKICGPRVTSEAFVLHRFQRSQSEYLALLGRGDPKFLGKFGLKFNRNGYISADTGKRINFDQEFITKYDNLYDDFIISNELAACVAKSRNFVKSRQIAMVDYMQTHATTNRLVKKLTKGVDAYFHPEFPDALPEKKAVEKPRKT